MNTIGIDNNLDRPRIKKLLVIGLFASFLTGIGDFMLGYGAAENMGNYGLAASVMASAPNLADWQMIAVFNSYVAVFWLLKPHSFITMFPKDLQKRVRPVTKEERRHTILMSVTLYPAVLAWMILSACQADINGFWPMFWTAYVEMMLISLGDLFFFVLPSGLWQRESEC